MRRTTGVFGRRVVSQQSSTLVSQSLVRPQAKRFSSTEVLKAYNTGESRFKLYHLTSIGLVVLLPIGLYTSPSVFSFPINSCLAVLIPAHAHLGARNIILDYVPRAFQGPANWGLRAATLLTFLGLLKINQKGGGISEGIKQLWKPTPPKEAKN